MLVEMQNITCESIKRTIMAVKHAKIKSENKNCFFFHVLDCFQHQLSQFKGTCRPLLVPKRSAQWRRMNGMKNVQQKL